VVSVIEPNKVSPSERAKKRRLARHVTDGEGVASARNIVNEAKPVEKRRQICGRNQCGTVEDRYTSAEHPTHLAPFDDLMISSSTTSRNNNA